MKDNQFLTDLKKALASLPKQARDDILLEIQSHIEELDEDGESLVKRFGSPQELAAQYLDGEEIKSGIGRKASSLGKKVLLSIGTTVVVLIVIAALVAHYYSKDDFNYANESATELTEGRNQWASFEATGPISLEIKQARVAIYWQENLSVDWKCKGDVRPEDFNSSAITIRQNNCLIFLPRLAASIVSDQASLVVVRPQASLEIKLLQSNLRIAENNNEYRYQIEDTRSNIDPLVSIDAAPTTIKIVARESMVEAYDY